MNINGKYFFETGNMYLALIPLAEGAFIVNPQPKVESQDFFEDYGLIAVPGNISGYIIETAEKSDYKTLQDFSQAISRKTHLDDSELQNSTALNYVSLKGDKIKMVYNPSGLRCQAEINGKKQDWDNFTQGAVYKSPYLKVKDGIMKVTDGKLGYEVDFRGDIPLYKEYNF